MRMGTRSATMRAKARCRSVREVTRAGKVARGRLRPMRHLPLALALLAAPVSAVEQPVSIVACAPGYPGSTAEAQPSMDTFAAALASAAGWAPGQVTASYAPTEKDGLARLGEASVALVALPFFVKHGASLRLTPRLVVEQKGLGPSERWTLVAKKGRVAKAADLAG